MKLNGISMTHHHVFYEEIHGYDLVILMPESEHRKLHYQLRKEGKCNIPVDELAKISMNSKYAIKRTLKLQKEYNHKYIFNKNLNYTLKKNVILKILITYNIKTNSICISSGIYGDHGHKLLVITLK